MFFLLLFLLLFFFFFCLRVGILPGQLVSVSHARVTGLFLLFLLFLTQKAYWVVLVVAVSVSHVTETVTVKGALGLFLFLSAVTESCNSAVQCDRRITTQSFFLLFFFFFFFLQRSSPLPRIHALSKFLVLGPQHSVRDCSHMPVPQRGMLFLTVFAILTLRHRLDRPPKLTSFSNVSKLLPQSV